MNRSGKLHLFSLLLGMLGSMSVSAEITTERMTAAAEEIRRIEEEFVRRSAPARLSILCLGRFADAGQKESLCALTSETAQALEPILTEQQELKRRMEDYPGRDWEELYGQTHLWSTCSRTVLKGQYLLTCSHFWRIFCVDAQRNKLLTEVIETCGNKESQWRGMEQILQVLALRQRGGPSDGEELRVILHRMMARSDTTEQARDQMLLLQKRFEIFSEGPFGEELGNLFKQKLEAQKDFEWGLEYAFLEFADFREQPLQKVMETWPQAAGFVSLLLPEAGADQFRQGGLQAVTKWSPWAISRMCEAVVGCEHPEQYRSLVEGLARSQEKPIVMLAMAEALCRSEPERAVEYYLKAARLRGGSPDNSVPSAAEIAERAARLGCRLYQEEPGRYGSLALRALQEYFGLAGGGAEPEIQYAAVGIFAEQGQEAQSRDLLARLAQTPGAHAVRARLDLFRIRARQVRDPQERKDLEEEWQTCIQSLDPNLPDTAGLRIEAAAEYVRHLFESPDRENAEKIVQFLRAEIRAGDPTLTYLYVQALTLLDRYGQAVIALSSVPTDCRNAAFDLFVLEGFADRLEEYTYLSGVLIEPPALQKAERLRTCFDSGGRERDRADLLWAELAARTPGAAGQTGDAIDEILRRFEQSPRVEVFRCRALRRMQRGQWADAVKDWQAVRAAYEPRDKTEKVRNWHWWRAKYYELLCYSKLPQDTAEDVAHAVEILRVLYDPPDACWDGKLRALAEEKK